MNFLELSDVELKGRRVLVRADLNVPLHEGAVYDDYRLRQALPTLEYIVAAGGHPSVISHLGRPEGVDESLSLRPIAAALDDLSQFEVGFVEGGSITVLENTRFDPGEAKNSDSTADRMADGFELFVQDAFGSVHRSHASTVGVANRLRSAGGLLLVKELKALSILLANPERPYVVVLGGAKVSDKLGVIESLLPRVDSMLIGGGMCFTFLAALGYEIGGSLVEESMIQMASEILRSEHGDKITLPEDLVVARSFHQDALYRTVPAREMPRGWLGLDIGPRTIESFAAVIGQSRTVFWNGPMGVFEWDNFATGTVGVADALSHSPSYSVVGGGDSVAAVRQSGVGDDIDHISTGGGAGLEFLEGKVLPGVKVLEQWNDGVNEEL